MNAVFSWAADHEGLLFWVGLGSFVFFVASLSAVPFLTSRLPPDYFRRYRAYRRRRWIRHPVLRPLFALARNAFGLVLLLAGAAMLVLPGQGILTIVAALMLLDFPGRDRLVLRMVRQPSVWRGLNWLRRRAGECELEAIPVPASRRSPGRRDPPRKR